MSETRRMMTSPQNISRVCASHPNLIWLKYNIQKRMKKKTETNCSVWRLCLGFALKRMARLTHGSHVPAKGANRLVGAVDDDGNIPV